MKKSTLKQLIKEELKTSQLKGSTFKHQGQLKTIKDVEIEDDRISIKDESGNWYNYKMLKQQGVEFIPKQKKQKEKSHLPPLMSKTEYYKQLKDAVDSMDESDLEYIYDVAESMVTDPNIVRRILKDNPNLTTKQDLIFQLQYDLENFI